MNKIFSALLLTAALLSCSKEQRYDGYFYFSKEGGPVVFNVEMEGETLSVQIDGKNSRCPNFWETGSMDDDALWTAEQDWLYASYQPSKHIVTVRAEENTTGYKRKAYVTGFLNGEMKIIEIDQHE